MTRITQSVPRKTVNKRTLPSYVRHQSFDLTSAAKTFDPQALLAEHADYRDSYMPDDITKEHARHMHYAAHRMHTAGSPAVYRKWHSHYIALRDRIVLGNRKLVYQAVRRRMGVSNFTDDLIGESQIVLIQAVAVFNPWLGIRFSTYAYTCLVRALARRARKFSTDWLTRALPLDQLPHAEPQIDSMNEPAASHQVRIEDYLRDGHTLLSDREKQILSKRFQFDELRRLPTLEIVGRELGLSKERVRQVQFEALAKLRAALTTTVMG